MLYLLLLIVALGIITALYHRIFSGEETTDVTPPSCTACNSDDGRCAHDCMIEAALNDIEYYDDEHLDKYAMRDADSYLQDEIDEFEEVLCTLRTEDVAGWCRSLALRNVNIPNQLKDEVCMMLS